MQIDSKMEPEFEDSEDEREYKEQQKNWSNTSFTLSASGVETGVLVVLTGDVSKTMAKIVFEEGWESLGKATAEHKDSKDEEKNESDEVAELFRVKQGVYMLLPGDKMKGGYVNQLVDTLSAAVSFTKFVILDDMYKTKYP